MPDTPQPVVTVETKVEAAAPDAVKPEVAQIEDEFNTAVADAAAKAPAAEEAAAQKQPGIDEAARDAATIASGGTVSSTELVGDAYTTAKAVKAGYKTTEFWVTVAVIVLSQVGALHLPGHYGTTITTTAAAAAYAISRGLAK